MEGLKIGDKVVSKAGGPLMVVSAVPQQAHTVDPWAPANIGIGWITCMWWNETTNMFGQWNFPEALLEKTED